MRGWDLFGEVLQFSFTPAGGRRVQAFRALIYSRVSQKSGVPFLGSH